MKMYDVAIIGAGTAGLSARSEVAKLTENYVVIDSGPLGTTCARVGCMPSKVLIQVAHDYHRRLSFEKMGIVGANNLSIDTTHVMSHVRKLRDRFVRGVKKSLESWQKTHLISKRARFIDQNTLDLEGEQIQAKKIIIATGSTPIIPEAWKQYASYLIDTDQFFELEKLPATMAVIGLGVIGIELGQAVARLGVQVQGIDLYPVVGGISDPEILDYAIETFQKDFPLSFSGAQILGEGEKGLIIKSGEQQWEFEKVFLSMGRRPQLKGLGLEKIGIELDERKIPVFDHNTYRIPETPLYIAGDVNAERSILHEAADEGRIAGYNSIRDQDQCFKRRTQLGIVFTDPNIANVGQSYQSLTAEKIDFVIGKVNYEGQGRSIVKLKEKGLLHLYAHRKTGKILGAEIFISEGEHLAHLISWAISLRLSISDALSLPYYHPVLEEGLRSALRKAASQLDPQNETSALELLRCQDPPAGTLL